jgi:hypothetical protein
MKKCMGAEGNLEQRKPGAGGMGELGGRERGSVEG